MKIKLTDEDILPCPFCGSPANEVPVQSYHTKDKVVKGATCSYNHCSMFGMHIPLNEWQSRPIPKTELDEKEVLPYMISAISACIDLYRQHGGAIVNLDPLIEKHNKIICQKFGTSAVGKQVDFSEEINEQKHLISVEQLAGNIVKEAMHKGMLAGLVLAECRFKTLSPARSEVDEKEILSEDGNSIFDLVEGFIAVDPKDLKAYRDAYDKILPQIDEIIHKRKVAAQKARKTIIKT